MSEKNFEKHVVTSNNMRTICEVIREIYWATEDKQIREKAVEAIRMAKRMNNRLREYKRSWDNGEWEENKGAIETEKLRRQKYEEEKK